MWSEVKLVILLWIKYVIQTELKNAKYNKKKSIFFPNSAHFWISNQVQILKWIDYLLYYCNTFSININSFHLKLQHILVFSTQKKKKRLLTIWFLLENDYAAIRHSTGSPSKSLKRKSNYFSTKGFSSDHQVKLITESSTCYVRLPWWRMQSSSENSQYEASLFVPLCWVFQKRNLLPQT